MAKRRVHVLAVGIGMLLAGCGDSTDINEFGGYGNNHPGAELPEGGEIRLDVAHTPDGPVAVLQVQAFSGGTVGRIAPEGECTDVSGRNHWPWTDYPSGTYADLGETVTFSHGSEEVTIDKFIDFTDHLARTHGIMYGGAPNTVPVVDPELFTDGETWEVTFEGSDDVNPASEVFFSEYPNWTLPAEVADQDNVGPITIADNAPFRLEWEVSDTNSNPEHTADRRFDFIIFNTAEGAPQYNCSLPADLETGEFEIPAAVINDLDPAGGVLIGRLTHELAEFDGHRLDLVSVHCAAVPYTIE